MAEPGSSATIRWKVHLRSAPDVVYTALATDGGRRRFWAESAIERDGVIEFRFADGTTLHSTILERREQQRFALTYFGGSRVTFDLTAGPDGGTDLQVSERNVPPAEREHNLPGWVSFLLTLKAAVDFDVDLRNHDPSRSWRDGYVDV